jgi:hypothetical protein
MEDNSNSKLGFLTFFYISVGTNGSSEGSHFYLLKAQLKFNLLLPKNSYLGFDFCFLTSVARTGWHIGSVDCGKGPF